MSHCPSATLNEVCVFQNGGTPSKAIPRYFTGDIPWITGADLVGPVARSARSFITEEAITSSATNKVPAGTVLLVTRTSVGKVAIAGTELCFSQDITALLPDSAKLDAGYLVHFLRTKEEHFSRYARGATIKGITREVVADLVIPLPPLQEQRRIAAILDQAETLRPQRRTALALLDSLTQSLFLDMFGDPVANPKGFEIKLLADVTKFENGDRSSNYPSGDDLKTSGILFLSTKNIVNNTLDLSQRQYITEEKFASLSRGKALSGDLIITLRGTLGSCCIFDGEHKTAFINAQMMLIRPTAKVLSVYLHALLTSDKSKAHFDYIGHGAAVPQLTSAQLAELKVLVPPLPLQQTFATRIASIEALKATHRRALAALDALFASLQQRAFAGAL